MLSLFLSLSLCLPPARVVQSLPSMPWPITSSVCQPLAACMAPATSPLQTMLPTLQLWPPCRRTQRLQLQLQRMEDTPPTPCHKPSRPHSSCLSTTSTRHTDGEGRRRRRACTLYHTQASLERAKHPEAGRNSVMQKTDNADDAVIEKVSYLQQHPGWRLEPSNHSGWRLKSSNHPAGFTVRIVLLLLNSRQLKHTANNQQASLPALTALSFSLFLFFSLFSFEKTLTVHWEYLWR